jgi:hypothetical protein
MIKFIQYVRRKSNLSIIEFRNFWREYATKVSDLGTDLKAVRLTLSTTLSVSENLKIILSRGTSQPYDGVAEMWVRSAPELLEEMQRPEIQDRIRELQRFQTEFMDLETSSFFFTSEDEVFDWTIKK